MRILVTGAAGFIGFHVAKNLLERGYEVVCIDNLNDYYDVSLKKARLRELEPYAGGVKGQGSGGKEEPCFRFLKLDIADQTAMKALFDENEFDYIVHLAAQAGVRYSLENPHSYVQSNIVGFLNVLEGCRKQGQGSRVREIQQNPCPLIYASSSSVYGANNKLPFSVADRVDQPISLYAATKRADELMAYTYSHLYGIRTTGLRFFTVYGPWGRPDMALFKFTKAILSGEPIDVYNEGKMRRDFTYIDDIVEGVVRIMEAGGRKQEADKISLNPASQSASYSIYNIGNHSPVDLMDFIQTLENSLGKKANMNFLPMQPGDVPATYAEVDDLVRDVGFAPKTPIKEGIEKFVEWYLNYYKLSLRGT